MTQLIFGLANRVVPYGLSCTSSSHVFDLVAVSDFGINIFDGALAYPWHESDIDYINDVNNAATCFTKVDTSKVSLSDAHKHINHFNKSYLRGVYYHGNVMADNFFISYTKLYNLTRDLGLPIGISIYNQDDARKISCLPISYDFIQLPVNPAFLDLPDTLSYLNPCTLVARSIFLQGAYFHPHKLPSPLKSFIANQISLFKLESTDDSAPLFNFLVNYSLDICKKYNFDYLIYSTTDIQKLTNFITVFHDLHNSPPRPPVLYNPNCHQKSLSFHDPRTWKKLR